MTPRSLPEQQDGWWYILSEKTGLGERQSMRVCVVTRRIFIFIQAISYSPWVFTGYEVLQTHLFVSPKSVC